MNQKQAGFLGVLLGLSLLAGCGSSGGGSGSGRAPTVSLSASPTSIFAGQSTTLTWASTNVTSVVIDNKINGVQPFSGGNRDVSPTQTTTYTVTAFGNG